MIPFSEVQKLLNIDAYRHDLYPNSHTVFTFSRPAYDAKADTAVVVYGFLCGALCGHHGVAVFTSVEHRWVLSGRWALEIM